MKAGGQTLRRPVDEWDLPRQGRIAKRAVWLREHGEQLIAALAKLEPSHPLVRACPVVDVPSQGNV